MRQRWALIGMTVLIPWISGCLIKDVGQTWYVDQEGAVTWVVIEKDVRSDAGASADRLGEEAAYYQAVMTEMHPVAQGFRAVGASRLRTRVLRAERPFTVVTEGRFSGLDVLGQGLIAAAALTGSSIVTRDAEAWEWTLTMRESQSDTSRDVSEDVQALLTDFERLRVVLVAGRFDRAHGFTLSQDRRVASFSEDGMSDADADGLHVLRLRWTLNDETAASRD